MKRFRVSVEVAIALAVFTVSAFVGAAYWRVFVASGAPLEFAQSESSAAVALACGHGFVDPGYAPTPAMGEFLQRKRDRITCADLPPGTPLQRASFSQGLYRYLMSAIALVWMLSGDISWSGLTPMSAIAYGWTMLAAYGLFRLGMGRTMSVLASLALLVSAVHLGYLPYFRDYAKAPFILTLILIMARLAMRPLTWRRALAFGAAFGLVLGIGFGFRNDLLINVVPWAAVVVLCLPGSLFSNLKLKALCLAVSAAVFVIAAWPILTAYSRGSNTGHVTLLGLMSSFDAPIGVAGSIYDWGYYYNDGFANRLINSFTYRQYGHPVGYVTPEYDRAMFVYIFKIIRHWPADFVARAYASTLRMLDDLPFSVGAYQNPIPYGIHNPSVLTFYDWQMSLLRKLHGMGALAVALALLVISARSVRAAVTLLLFVLYFTGYPAIQFSVRHFFHLEFIAWWAVAFLLESACVALWSLFRRRPWISPTVSQPGRAAVRVGVFAVAGVLLVAGPLFVLRSYQSAHVRSLLEDLYFRAEREPVALAKTAASDGHVLMDMPALWSGRNPTEDTSTEYIVAEFSPRHCGVSPVPATFRYTAKIPDADFSHDVRVPFGFDDESTVVFFPALYDPVYAQFKGIEIAATDADCLVGVSRVRKDRIPEVLLDVAFVPHWRNAKLYQTLTKLEAPDNGERLPAYFVNPPSLVLPVRSRLTRVAAPTPAAEYVAPIVTQRPDGSRVIKGYPELRYSQVLVIKDQQFPAGAIVMAGGNLRAGGITFGLIHDGVWATSVNIVSRGEFVGAVAAPADGTYWVVLANFVRGGWIESHFPDRFAEFLLSVPGLRRENDVVVTTLGWAPPLSAAIEKATH